MSNEFHPPSDRPEGNPWSHTFQPQSETHQPFLGSEGYDQLPITPGNEYTGIASTDTPLSYTPIAPGKEGSAVDHMPDLARIERHKQHLLETKAPWEMTDAEYDLVGLPRIDALTALYPEKTFVGDRALSEEGAYYNVLHAAKQLRDEYKKEAVEAQAKGAPPPEKKSILVVDYGAGTGDQSKFVQEADPRYYSLIHTTVKDGQLLLNNLDPSHTINAVANTAARDNPDAAAAYVDLLERLRPILITENPKTGKPVINPQRLAEAIRAADKDPSAPTVLSSKEWGEVRKLLGVSYLEASKSTISALRNHIDTAFRTTGSDPKTNIQEGQPVSPVELISIGVGPGFGTIGQTEVIAAGNLTLAALHGTARNQPNKFVGVNFHRLPPELQKEIKETLVAQGTDFSLVIGEVNDDNKRILDGTTTILASPVNGGDARLIPDALPPVRRVIVKGETNNVSANDGTNTGGGTNTGREYGTDFDKTSGGSDSFGDSTGVTYSWTQNADFATGAPIDPEEITSMHENRYMVITPNGDVRGYFDALSGRLVPDSPLEERRTLADVRSEIAAIKEDQNNLRRERLGQSATKGAITGGFPSGGKELTPFDSEIDNDAAGNRIRPRLAERPPAPALKPQESPYKIVDGRSIAEAYNRATGKSIHGAAGRLHRRDFLQWVWQNHYLSKGKQSQETFESYVASRWPGMQRGARQYDPKYNPHE